MPFGELDLFSKTDDDINISIDDLEDADLEALAEMLYRLLRQELRLERERQGWYQQW